MQVVEVNHAVDPASQQDNIHIEPALGFTHRYYQERALFWRKWAYFGFSSPQPATLVENRAVAGNTSIQPLPSPAKAWDSPPLLSTTITGRNI